MAGSETTSNTVEFAILYLMKHPEIQQKMQAEIDTVVGRNRLPCISDKPKYVFGAHFHFPTSLLISTFNI